MKPSISPLAGRHTRRSLARLALHATAIGVAFASGAPQAQADAFPSKPVRIVVPYTAGGPTDLMARAVAKHMSTQSGQPVTVENRGGAGGTIGTVAVARAPADGYTLVVNGTLAHVLNPQLMPKTAGYVPEDLAAIGMFSRSPMLLTVATTLNIKTVQELIDLAKAQGGKLTYSSAGPATNPHLAAELFKALAGVDMEHIPYKGVSATVPDLVSGRVPVAFASPSLATPLLKDNRIVALAVTASQRVKGWEQLPTLAEAGVPGYMFESSYVMMAPAKTPQDIVTRLNQLLQQALSDAETQKAMGQLGLETVNNTPQQAQVYIDGELARWSAVLKRLKLSLE